MQLLSINIWLFDTNEKSVRTLTIGQLIHFTIGRHLVCFKWGAVTYNMAMIIILYVPVMFRNKIFPGVFRKGDASLWNMHMISSLVNAKEVSKMTA